jgi:hypothetical protein
MTLVKLETNNDKEIYTVKINQGYHGVVVGDDHLYVTEEAYASPLVAANAARKLKRENKIIKTVKKKSDVTYTAIQTKIRRVKKLYTETEVASLTHLRFRESWIILNSKGEYVKTVLSDNKVVDYCKKENQAKTFKTYEEASDYQKTLDRVVKVGHTLRRYFVEAD